MSCEELTPLYNLIEGLTVRVNHLEGRIAQLEDLEGQERQSFSDLLEDMAQEMREDDNERHLGESVES